MKIKITLAFLLIFTLSCNQKDKKSIAEDEITKPNLKDGDTIYKSNDTILIKNHEWIDTLAKYKPIEWSKYFVKPEKVRFDKKLDFSEYEYKKTYITRTTNEVKEHGMNFAGHYSFVYWGCGSACKLSAVIDLKTGKVYSGLPAGTGYQFKKDSRLLIVNPPDSSNWYNITVPYGIPEEYIWTGERFEMFRNL